MKQQNDHNKTKHYSAYDDQLLTHERYNKAIADAAQGCWWIEAYLRGGYTNMQAEFNSRGETANVVIYEVSQ